MPEYPVAHSRALYRYVGRWEKMMSVCKKKVVYVVQDGESFDSVFSEFRFAEDYVKKCPGKTCRSVIKVELQEGYCDEIPPSHEMHLRSNISTKLSPEEKEAFDLMFQYLAPQ